MERNEEQENKQSQRTHQKLESRSKIENVPDTDTVYDSIFSAGGAYFNISDPVECEGDYGSVVSGDRIYSGIRDTDS